jgi:ATPase subunit of ABC transporter with duplicated ATPase domains
MKSNVLNQLGVIDRCLSPSSQWRMEMKLLIARAILPKADLLFLEEPPNHLSF